MTTFQLNERRARVPSLWRDRRGLSTVEYVIILVLIAAAAVGTWSAFGQTIRGKVKASIGEMRDVNVK